MNSQTPSRADVMAEARRWVGTPYHDQGRMRRASCDCIGLVRGVADALGFAVPDPFPVYGRLPHDMLAEGAADRFMARAGGRPMPGQIGLFWWRHRGNGQHFAIFAEHGGRLTMIHAYAGLKRVTEAGLNDFWRARLLRVYDYREIANAH